MRPLAPATPTLTVLFVDMPTFLAPVSFDFYAGATWGDYLARHLPVNASQAQP
jgi:hypothetical protein